MFNCKLVNDIEIGDKIELSGNRVMTVTQKTDRGQHHVKLSLINENSSAESDICFNRMDAVVMHKEGI